MVCARRAKRVLDYLRDMMDVCRGFHRHDLLREYQDAWEVAAVAIYGALPPRKPIAANFAYVSLAPKAPTFWRQQMLDSPLKKIVGRFHEERRDRRLGMVATDYEMLECGHRVTAGVHLPDSPPAKRRHCSQCSKQKVSPAVGAEVAAVAGAARPAALPRFDLGEKKPPAPAASYAQAKRRC
ncbi:MAG: hypothetical protein LAO20_14190 [Acidobacteriia bacterium]|nr:hypothetical protein [Terriglobia bacterium]